MKIELPGIKDQQLFVLEQSTKEAIKILNENLKAPQITELLEIDESEYSNSHLLEKGKGWEAPHPEIVRAYFNQFQAAFEEYNTDKKLAALLGLSSDRRIRAFKKGAEKAPFGLWQHFLIITGRSPQQPLKVLAIFK